MKLVSSLRLFFILSLFAVLIPLQASVIEGKPNLILILSDDQGYSDIGCYGAKGFSTPHIDKMAREGIRFTSYYSAPTCSPARASLLTGSYYQRVGVGRPLNNQEMGLHPDEITIAELLKGQGYATALIGKWHLGLSDEMSPVAQGFDYFSGIPLSHIRAGVTEHTHGPRKYYRRQWKTMGKGIKTEIEYEPDETLFTKRCTQEALSFIKKNADKPFFLYLSHAQVHKEVMASEEFSGRTEMGRYGDACEELDWSVGEVLKTLKDLKIDDNTLVIYTSDNGPWLNQGDQSGTATPLRGGKFSTWEGGMRVPCIIRWPKQIPAGLVCDELVSVMDITPTFIKLTGSEMPADRVIDGKDIWPLLSGEAGARSPHESYFYYHVGILTGVRFGKWKYHSIKGGSWELFDLESDLGETRDVQADHPEVVDRMKKLLEQARNDLGDGKTGREGKNTRPLGVLEKSDKKLNNDSWTFVSMPDFLNVDCDYPQEGWEDALSYVLESVKQENPDFLVVAGDLVMGHWDGPEWNDKDTIAKYSQRYYSAWINRINDHGLKFYTSIGDHEIGDNPWRSSKKLEAVELYKKAFSKYMDMPKNGPKHMNGTAFWWRHKNVLFISTDVFEEGNSDQGLIKAGVTGDQLEWLKQVLEENMDVDHRIVLGHAPVLGPVRKWSSSGLMIKEGRESEFWQTMKKYDVDAYLCGEVHAITCTERDGIMQIAHGGLIGYNTRTNYMVVSVSKDKIELEIKEIAMLPHGKHLWQTKNNRPLENVTISEEDKAKGFYPVGFATIDKTKKKQFIDRKGYFLTKYETSSERALPVFKKENNKGLPIELPRITMEESD